MDEPDIEQHPDLLDPQWRAKAEKEAKAEARKRNREFKKAGRRTKAAWRSEADKRRRKRKLVLAAVAVLVVAAGTISLINYLRPASSTASSSPATSGPSSPRTTAADFATVDLANPFAKTPAEAWRPGAAGLTAPAPAPVGEHSADRVAKAYEEVRALISAAHLDPAALERHDPAPLLALLSPFARDQLRPTLTDQAHPEFIGYLTRVAKGKQLLPVAPRMTGTLTATTGEHGGLVVRANFAVAYAFRPTEGGRPRPMDIIAVRRTDTHYLLVTDPRFAQTSRGWHIERTETGAYSIDCAAWKAGFLASSPGSIGIETPADREAPFDPNKPMPRESSCP